MVERPFGKGPCISKVPRLDGRFSALIYGHLENCLLPIKEDLLPHTRGFLQLAFSW